MNQDTQVSELENKEVSTRNESGKDIISYEDFAKLDIAIGTIASVEVVEGADKLLRLMVDVDDRDENGEKIQRQIISGIREYFEDIDFLVGKQCPFLINLEPRVIRGYESQGMILAAESGGIFSLLIPHNELPSGTRVS